jgi:phthalate 4,5-dioxygenase oxygenase subunit
MGPITDHSLEHLGPGDLMIARTRRRALQAARAFRDTGALPPGVENPDVFLASRSGYFLAEPGKEWLAAYAEQVDACVRPAGETVPEDGQTALAK